MNCYKYYGRFLLQLVKLRREKQNKTQSSTYVPPSQYLTEVAFGKPNFRLYYKVDSICYYMLYIQALGLLSSILLIIINGIFSGSLYTSFNMHARVAKSSVYFCGEYSFLLPYNIPSQGLT